MVVFLLSLLLVLPCLLLALLYLKFYYWPYGVLEQSGIKGPKPSFFYGNFKDLAKVGALKYLKEQHEKYGAIVGYYVGQTPNVSITDLALVKLITIKDFDNFINRPAVPSVLRKKPGGPSGLTGSRDEAWMSARKTLSPAFSASKMKATILATAFGRVINILKGESDQLAEAASTIFGGAREGSGGSALYLIALTSNLPWIVHVFRYMARGTKRQKAHEVLQGTAIQLVQQRRKDNNPAKYKDILQLMIDATVEDAKSSRQKLTEEEITAHAILFMLAGYETTANTLSYTSYLLALNPHVQEKLQEEIDSFFEENPDVSLYQAAQDLQYLDMVLQESMRLYPPAPLYRRECMKDYKYEDITIPKGASIVIPSFVLHMDPTYWPEPEKFEPLRFTAEEKAKRPQLCYMPFGSGPRNCIGMRFALLEAKIALVEILKKFTFVRAPSTQVPLETQFGITMSPKHGIYLKLANRFES